MFLMLSNFMGIQDSINEHGTKAEIEKSGVCNMHEKIEDKMECLDDIYGKMVDRIKQEVESDPVVQSINEKSNKIFDKFTK